MNQFEVVQIIALVGWLILAVSAFAARGLNWKTSLRHALIWAVIITGLMLLVTMIRWGCKGASRRTRAVSHFT